MQLTHASHVTESLWKARPGRGVFSDTDHHPIQARARAKIIRLPLPYSDSVIHTLSVFVSALRTLENSLTPYTRITPFAIFRIPYSVILPVLRITPFANWYRGARFAYCTYGTLRRSFDLNANWIADLRSIYILPRWAPIWDTVSDYVIRTYCLRTYYLGVPGSLEKVLTATRIITTAVTNGSYRLSWDDPCPPLLQRHNHIRPVT